MAKEPSFQVLDETLSDIQENNFTPEEPPSVSTKTIVNGESKQYTYNRIYVPQNSSVSQDDTRNNMSSWTAFINEENTGFNYQIFLKLRNEHTHTHTHTHIHTLGFYDVTTCSYFTVYLRTLPFSFHGGVLGCAPAAICIC